MELGKQRVDSRAVIGDRTRDLIALQYRPVGRDVPKTALFGAHPRDGLRELVVPRDMHVERRPEGLEQAVGGVPLATERAVQPPRCLAHAAPHQAQAEHARSRRPEVAHARDIGAVELRAVDVALYRYAEALRPLRDVLAPEVGVRAARHARRRQHLAQQRDAGPRRAAEDVRREARAHGVTRSEGAG